MMGTQNEQGRCLPIGSIWTSGCAAIIPCVVCTKRSTLASCAAEVAALYGANGNESVDPAVILKMMFLLFFENVASERELMRVIPERLDYLWFLGYGLDEVIPDHSVLSKARTRWGRDVFEKFFVRTVGQCVGAGLVDGTKLHVDSSLNAAHAACDSVRTAAPS